MVVREGGGQGVTPFYKRAFVNGGYIGMKTHALAYTIQDDRLYKDGGIDANIFLYINSMKMYNLSQVIIYHTRS